MMLFISRFLSVVCILTLCAGLAGCGKGKSSTQGGAATPQPQAEAAQLQAQSTKLQLQGNGVFDNATPEIKDAWDKAVAADKANDYVTAVTSYKQILTHQTDIPEAQYSTARTAFGLLNQRLVNASLSGDAKARDALNTLRKNEMGR